MKKIVAVTFWLGLVCIACKKNTTSSVQPVDLVKNLAKGVNLSNWFNDYSDPGQYGNRFTLAALQKIKSLGFTCVRIPLGNTILFNAVNPEVLNAANLAFVDLAVKNATDAGLAVTINLHPWKNDMDSALAADANTVSKVAAYWKAVAGFFKKYPPGKICFEVYNEPHASAGRLTTQQYNWWQNVQGRFIAAIRSVTPDHYIIVGGEGWNSIDGLKQLQPYAQQKIIYNFHFYEPFVFTHQGATWVGDTWALLRNVPYPSNPENVAPLIAASASTEVKNLLAWYGGYRFNKDTLDKQVKVAADWAVQNNVPVICNEFGAYKPYAPVQSRISCLTDVRSVLEKYNIGWCMWEYDEGFGLIEYTNNNRALPVGDSRILQALGL